LRQSQTKRLYTKGYSGKIYTKKYETEGSSTRNELLITVEGERERERERDLYGNQREGFEV
jgi:hypothetical protein